MAASEDGAIAHRLCEAWGPEWRLDDGTTQESGKLCVLASAWLLVDGWPFRWTSSPGVSVVVIDVDGTGVEGTPLQGLPTIALAEALEGPPRVLGTRRRTVPNPTSERVERVYGWWRLSRRASPPPGADEQLAAALAELPTVVGTIVGARQWVCCLGVGPVATVYAGRDLDGGVVAVRVLHDPWRNTPVGEAYRSLGKGPPLLERIYGERTLEQTLPRADRLGVVLDAARGLKALHDAGETHGSIKPSNVLVVQGRGVLVDRHLPGAPRGDSADAVYIGPELHDPLGVADPISDLYSLNMVALRVFSGAALPFWVLRDPERLLRELDIPPSVRHTIRRSLEVEREGRHPTVSAWVQDLLDDAAVVLELLQSGDRDRVNFVLEHLPDHPEVRTRAVWLVLGRTRLLDGELADAQEAFEHALDGATGDEQCAALIGLADLAGRREGAQARIEALEQAVDRVDPEQQAEVLGLWAQALDNARRGDEALPVWKRVVETHVHRDQAAGAFTQLFAAALAGERWSEALRWGEALQGYRSPDDRSQAALELGRLAMDRVGDPTRAVFWLQQVAGRQAEVGRRLEVLRSARGEWRQVVALLLDGLDALDDAEAVERLSRAAKVAVHAHQHDDAATIHGRLLLRDPDHRPALRALARHHLRSGRHAMAVELFGRLSPHQACGDESIALRVDDNLDYARALLQLDRPRGAELCLAMALSLQPGHLPTLTLMAQLAFDLGKWDEARAAATALSTLTRTTRWDATYCAGLRMLGELELLDGDLVVADAHFNEALVLDPRDWEAWWGRTKVALAALHDGSHLTSDAPWMASAPMRFTPQEGLARLLEALIERPGLERWMALDPRGGRLVAAHQDRPLGSLVRAGVDLLVAAGLVRSSLFSRLLEARPAWESAIRGVEALWFASHHRAMLTMGEAYSWTGGKDFSVDHHREVICFGWDPDENTEAFTTVLDASSAWAKLLALEGEVPVPPAADGATREQPVPVAVPVLVMFPDAGLAARRYVRLNDGDVAGTDPQLASIPIAGLDPEHVRFEKVGEVLYVRALGSLRVNGVDVRERRLFGGETLLVGSVEMRFLFTDEATLSRDGLTAYRPTAVPTSGGETPERAALFFPEGPYERMVPLVDDPVGLGLDGDGGVCRTAPADSLVGVEPLADGRYCWADDPTRTALEHGAFRHVGIHRVDFRLLSDLAAGGWGEEVGPVLIYEDGSRHGRPLRLPDGPFSIGRGRDADFQITADGSLSRVHCIVRRQGAQVFLEDAGSSNGTRANGMAVESPIEIVSGDLIEIGASRMTLRVPLPDAHGDLGDDLPTDIVPMDRLRGGVLLEEGREKVLLANQALNLVAQAMDRQDGPGRGGALLANLVAANPRSYQGLLLGFDGRRGLPVMDLLFHLMQRPELEQRPLLNLVLRDLIERAVDGVVEVLDEAMLEKLLSDLAAIRYRERLRF